MFESLRARGVSWQEVAEQLRVDTSPPPISKKSRSWTPEKPADVSERTWRRSSERPPEVEPFPEVDEAVRRWKKEQRRSWWEGSIFDGSGPNGSARKVRQGFVCTTIIMLGVLLFVYAIGNSMLEQEKKDYPGLSHKEVELLKRSRAIEEAFYRMHGGNVPPEIKEQLNRAAKGPVQSELPKPQSRPDASSRIPPPSPDSVEVSGPVQQNPFADWAPRAVLERTPVLRATLVYPGSLVSAPKAELVDPYPARTRAGLGAE